MKVLCVHCQKPLSVPDTQYNRMVKHAHKACSDAYIDRNEPYNKKRIYRKRTKNGDD